MSQQPSNACCTTPPIVAKGYQEKGRFVTIDGLKTYTTGPASAKKGIFVVYDVFGFASQTLQAADILSTSDKEQQYKVYMPDILEGQYADHAWFPPDTEEKGKKLGEYFGGPAAPPKAVARVSKIIEILKKDHPDITSWGILGYCWGGKVVNLSSFEGTAFKASAAGHPAMVDPKDAPNVVIPNLLIPSKGEDQNDVDNYQKALKVPNEVYWYKDQEHGFMAARSDLEDPKVVAAYEKAYQQVLAFFHKHL